MDAGTDTSLECNETIHLTPGRRGISDNMDLKAALKQINNRLLDAHVGLHNTNAFVNPSNLTCSD